jgi:hypothetical protein
MGSRERRRAERRKRKERSVERRAELAARSEQRNEAAREALEPLRADERPTVVTIGAVVSVLLALSVVVGYTAGVEVSRIDRFGVESAPERPPLIQVLVPVVLFGVMAWGMWRARYWAVLGFQVVLVIALVAASLGLVQATEWTQAIGNTALIAAAGAMFYFMIRALARIQMPERVR